MAAAVELTTPVTPSGSVGNDVFIPKPKSEPSYVAPSYQTVKFRPSTVVKVKPPLPLSAAVTPCVDVLELMLSMTYCLRSGLVCVEDKLNETLVPLT